MVHFNEILDSICCLLLAIYVSICDAGYNTFGGLSAVGYVFNIGSVSFWGFPGGSVGKESACNAGDLGPIPELGRSHGEGNGYPLQDSGLENSVDCIVHGVARSQTRLSDFNFFISSLMLW